MNTSLFELLGNYAALSLRLESQKGGTTAEKKHRTAAVSALKAKHAALAAAHQKLRDAMHEYETAAGTAVASVNKSLAPLRTGGFSPAQILAEQHVEYAMTSGAHYLDHLALSHSLSHHEHPACNVGSGPIIPPSQAP